MRTSILSTLALLLAGQVGAQETVNIANSPRDGKLLFIMHSEGNKRMAVVPGPLPPYKVEWIDTDYTYDQLWQIKDSEDFYLWSQIYNPKYDCYFKQDGKDYTCDKQHFHTVL
jgi:hypothetical protein